MKTGTLYLIPSPMGSPAETTRLFPAYNLEVISRLNAFIVENVRTARRFIAGLGQKVPIDRISFSEIGKRTAPEEFPALLKPLLDGKDMGLLSEAGVPCIADPGAGIVKLAQQQKIRVVPLIGPSSILLALMGSGFNGQNFAFHGYLPVDKAELHARIKKLESDALSNDQTQIFIETPFRNGKLFESLLKSCHPATQLCIAYNLTLPGESIRSMPVASWKKTKVDLHKKPAVFLFYRS